MTRMSREFSLVLLGAGILTAGYFAAPSPEEELEKKADEQAARRVGHEHNTYHRHHGGVFLFLHSPGYAGGNSARPASHPSVTRGGFGGGSGTSGGS